MKKNYSQPNGIFILALLAAIVYSVFYFSMPQTAEPKKVPLSSFSTQRALHIVKKVAKQPHYIGSQNHEIVVQVLQNELQKLGLQPTLQEGFTMTEKGTLVYSKNIVATIKGTQNTKSLVLLSHYDSAPHSASLGASDDASGIATILETIRVFLHNKKTNKNDIIILFSDAEEIGLNGAALFVTQHKLAKNIGLVLNLEARGTSGPSYMLMETNQGNANMVSAFANSKTPYPVSNSLLYSIYKMLPNDTDLTVFREKNNTQGFNFAFIDNHFNYHTSQDNVANLNLNSLAHQGSYFVALLHYFSNANLNNLSTTSDEVYFTPPKLFIHYPFGFILPMLFLAIGLFLFFTFIGLGKRVLQPVVIFKGFLQFFLALLISGSITYFGWLFIKKMYPQYNDILHGFTYNGHSYIYAFVCLSLAICFFIYKKPVVKNEQLSQSIAPILIWIVINILITIKLQGAAFMIIPVIGSILALGYFVVTQKNNFIINTICALPLLVILPPFIEMFPIGLGLKLLYGSALLTALCFGLLLPLVSSINHKKTWASLCLLLAVGFFYKAHQTSTYTTNRPKPNSLVYIENATTNKAYFATYDINLDDYTKKYLGDKPQNATILNTNKLYSKYGSMFTFMKPTALQNIPKPTILFTKDSVVGSRRYLNITISANRSVNRYDVFANPKMDLKNLKANGVKALEIKSNIIQKNTTKILSYYVVDNMPLTMSFSIDATQKLDMDLYENSFNLCNNPYFKMQPRTSSMIATPFVLNDAIIIKQKIKPSPKVVVKKISI